MSDNTAELGLEVIRSHGRHLEVVPEIDDQHPQQEGVFLPEYGNSVVGSRIDRVPELDTPFGKFWLKKIVMEDGVKYENVVGIPNQPSGATAIFTPAWFTDHKDGYNLEMAEDAVELGYTTIIHSAELNKVIPLSKSAYNMHLALEDTSHFDTYNPKDVVLLGDSRGAMIGFGFAAYAEQFGVKIRGGQLVDPCVAHPIGLEDVKHIPEYAQHLLEGYSLFRQVGRLTLTQILRYSKTLRPEVRFMLQQARIGQPIFSGEAGNLGRAIPKNQELDVLLFTKSTANHAANWREIFKNSSIRLEERSGTHLSIANPLTRMTKLITLEYLIDRPQAA